MTQRNDRFLHAERLPERSAWRFVGASALLLIGLTSVAARAESVEARGSAREQDTEEPQAPEERSDKPPASDDDVDPETATPDPAPPVPTVLEHTPRESRVTVVEQAGVGGPLSYASATVLEVGGSGSLSVSGGHLYLRMAPFVSWFVRDGLSLSYMHEIYVSKQDAQYRVATAPMLGATVHFRVTDRLLIATGPAGGALYNGEAWGVLGRLKLGLDILVGRSGVLHPSIYGSWSSDDTIDPGGSLVLGQHFSAGFDIAYAAMF